MIDSQYVDIQNGHAHCDNCGEFVAVYIQINILPGIENTIIDLCVDCSTILRDKVTKSIEDSLK